MTRRYTTTWDGDPPEIVISERIEAIAYDLERIADVLEEIAGDDRFPGLGGAP